MMKLWVRENVAQCVHFTFKNGWTMSIRTWNSQEDSTYVEIASWRVNDQGNTDRGSIIGPIFVDQIDVYMQEIRSR